MSSPSTLSSGSCLVEGETELTAHLSDNRAQSSKMLNSMTMTRCLERVEVCGTRVGGGRVSYDYNKDSCFSVPVLLTTRCPNAVHARVS